MYHINDLKRFMRCPRLFQLSLDDQDTSFNPYVRFDNEVSKLAMQKLKIEEHFLGVVNDDPSLALEALKNYEWIVKGRFEYNNLRVKAPFLHKRNNGFDLYFLFLGNYPHEDDILFYSSMVWVLINNNIVINDVYIVHLNSKYIRQDELDPDELFIISKHFYNANNNKGAYAKDLIFKRIKNYSEVLFKMDKAISDEVYMPVRVKACSRFGKCKYYDICFKDELLIENNSILTLVSSQYKYDMHNNGIKYLKDVDLALLEGSRKQFAQIMADTNGGLFFDKIALKTWLAKLQYPLSFLDFEWETYAIPPYKGMKSYDVLPFQYSLHVIEEDNIVHKEFLETDDTREALALRLINDVPLTGSIIAYNGDAAEKIRIKELAAQFPKLSKKLMKIHSRIVDLQFPFDAGIVYDTRMAGQYSLKKIMSLFDDEGYKNLEIHQGMDAVFSWRTLETITSEEEINAVKDNLKAYCGMDTYAMIVVYKWLKNLVR